MRLATKAESAILSVEGRPSPPQLTPVVQQVAVERNADRGPQLFVDSDQQVLIQDVSIGARVIT